VLSHYSDAIPVLGPLQLGPPVPTLPQAVLPPKKRCVFRQASILIKKKGLPQLRRHSTLFQSFPLVLLYYSVLTKGPMKTTTTDSTTTLLSHIM
jgi:hypothetical protein